MYILKAIFLYLLVALFPVMFVYLTASDLVQAVLLTLILVGVLTLFLYSDKLLLLFLGAREVIDSDHQKLFQVLKSEIYREVEEMPSIYLYSGHRLKAFVLNLRSSWAIVLDRRLLEKLSDSELKSLVRYFISYKKLSISKSQTIGMGVSCSIIRSVYWFWQALFSDTKKHFYKSAVFISFIMLKPLIEVILKLSVSYQKIDSDAELKSIYLQQDNIVQKKSFMEFMFLHLERDLNLRESTIEYLERFPLLENCNFVEEKI